MTQREGVRDWRYHGHDSSRRTSIPALDELSYRLSLFVLLTDWAARDGTEGHGSDPIHILVHPHLGVRYDLDDVVEEILRREIAPPVQVHMYDDVSSLNRCRAAGAQAE